MKIISPNVIEIIDFEGTENFYKSVARAARICYASENNGNDESLVKRLIKSKHYSPFAHSIVYIDYYKYDDIKKGENHAQETLLCCINNMYSIDFNGDTIALNGRVIVESCEFISKKYCVDCFEVLNSFLESIKDVEKKSNNFKSFIVDTSIGCTREINRHHDNFYICEQSTRYCNFSKDKFGNEVAFNKPYWFDIEEKTRKEEWIYAMGISETNYLNMLKCGFSIDQARGCLNLDTHTKAIYTATIDEWNHFINLRLKGTTGKPHGDIMIIASEINQYINA